MRLFLQREVLVLTGEPVWKDSPKTEPRRTAGTKRKSEQSLPLPDLRRQLHLIGGSHVTCLCPGCKGGWESESNSGRLALHHKVGDSSKLEGSSEDKNQTKPNQKLVHYKP